MATEALQLPATMKALRISAPTKGEDCALSDVSVPQPAEGRVLIRVRAFGLNHSEKMLRDGEIEADYIQKPVIPGIECVGEVVDGGGTWFEPGEKVVALMGGMGRNFDGGYAEYASVPDRQVKRVPADLAWDWAHLAAFPETYFTAWGSLFECLQLQEGDNLLVRGATCGLGYVAAQLAKAAGATVVGTTHRTEHMQELPRRGFDAALLDQDGKLAGTIPPQTKVLDLVGPRDLADTMRCCAPGGTVCVTGVLGKVYEWKDFDPIADIPNGVRLTSFHSNSPTQRVFDAMFAFMKEHGLEPILHKAYRFADLREALVQQDAGSKGKLVVVVDA